MRRNEMQELVKLAETVLSKARLAQDRGDLKGVDEVEMAIAKLSNEAWKCREVMVKAQKEERRKEQEKIDEVVAAFKVTGERVLINQFNGQTHVFLESRYNPLINIEFKSLERLNPFEVSRLGYSEQVWDLEHAIRTFRRYVAEHGNEKNGFRGPWAPYDRATEI